MKPTIRSIAQFRITTKEGKISEQGFVVDADTREERDRAFGVVSKLNPDARNVALISIGQEAVR
jgi:hypothetical protein